jgi:D-alanyl-D-alanine carboxypeptidase (penicillin-binding protein 5/6)
MPDMKAMTDAITERRQVGIALLFCSLILGATLFLVPKADKEAAAPAAVATSTAPDAYAYVPIRAKAAIVMDLATGQPLFERNADAQLPLASLTKLLTTYAALNTLSSSTPVAITPEALSMDGDSGLADGETFDLEDLARFALVASSNDAAEAIALAAGNHVAQSPEALLKNAAAAAGLSQTYAVNGTGLDESATISGGYGSARDVARLAGELLVKAPDIAHATTLPSVTVRSLEGTAHTLPNTDIEVEHFPNLLLSKTGYTDLAGGNLAIVFDAGLNHPIAVVVLGSTEESRFTDVNALVNATLAHFAGLPAQAGASGIHNS